MSEVLNADQVSQQGGDQQPIPKKAKRDLEAMKEMGENEKEEQKDKVEEIKKAPTVSEKYNSDDADISLISSDNVLFKVHSYRLMAASSIFRNMLLMPNFAVRRDPIYLTDEKLENEDVLEILLDILYTLKTTDLHCVEMFAVLDLADKWDFDHVRHNIRRDLARCDTNGYTFPRFKLAIKLKDPGLIADLPRRKHDVHWVDTPDEPAIDYLRRHSVFRQVYDEVAPGLLNEHFVGGGRMFDAATWSYGHVLLTPPTVLWAMLRATHVGTTTPAKIDSDKVANEFERLLTLAYKPEKADADKNKGNGGN